MRIVLSGLFGLIFVVVTAVASLAQSWTAEPLPRTAALYPGEELLSTNGIEALAYFRKGDPERPLVIFVPGGFHLARVAYGYPGGRDEDFLAHWLEKQGYSFLGASYPTGNHVFSSVYPAFSIREWGRQVAAVAKYYINREMLPERVIVLGWSAGGQIAQSVYEALSDADIELELFVALAATPPIPMLLAAPGEISKAPSGLSAAPQAYDLFKKFITAQNELNGHTIIPWQVFEPDVLGDIPVALNAIMMASRYENGDFVKDMEWSIADTGALKFADFPMIVTISGNKVLDNDHALTDHGNWGIYQIQHLYRKTILPALKSSEDIDPRNWQALMDQMSAATAGILSARVNGNHFFWYGEVGARETANQIDVLRSRAETLKMQLSQTVQSLKDN